MTSWDAMWRTPFYQDDDTFMRWQSPLSTQPSSSTTTIEYRAGKATVWVEEDARVGDEAWKEREAKA